MCFLKGWSSPGDLLLCRFALVLIFNLLKLPTFTFSHFHSIYQLSNGLFWKYLILLYIETIAWSRENIFLVQLLTKCIYSFCSKSSSSSSSSLLGNGTVLKFWWGSSVWWFYWSALIWLCVLGGRTVINANLLLLQTPPLPIPIDRSIDLRNQRSPNNTTELGDDAEGGGEIVSYWLILDVVCGIFPHLWNASFIRSIDLFTRNEMVVTYQGSFFIVSSIAPFCLIFRCILNIFYVRL